MTPTLQILRYWFTGAVSGKGKPTRSGQYGTHWVYSNKNDEVRDTVLALLERIGVSASEYSPTAIRVSHAGSIEKIRDKLLVLDLLPAEDRAAWEAVGA